MSSQRINPLVDEISWQRPASISQTEHAMDGDALGVVLATLGTAIVAALCAGVLAFAVTAPAVAMAVGSPGDHGGGAMAGGLAGGFAAVVLATTAYFAGAWSAAARLTAIGDRALPMSIAAMLPLVIAVSMAFA